MKRTRKQFGQERNKKRGRGETKKEDVEKKELTNRGML